MSNYTKINIMSLDYKPIPIYWIHYTDENDSKRFLNKIIRTQKILNNKSVVVKHTKKEQSKAHIKTIKLALQNKENQIIIIEDKTSFTDINAFKLLTQQPFTFNQTKQIPKILHLGGYLEEKNYNTNNNLTSNWIQGQSRDLFAYWINLDSELQNINYDNNIISWSDFIYKNTSAIHSPMLIIPYGYDINNTHNLMKQTLDGLSMVQISEIINNDNQYNQVNLKFDSIPEKELPRITLLTVINDQRLWWPLLRFNIDNLDYPTHKMKWLIIETTESKLVGYDIEDLLPPIHKRGNSNGWHLDYIKKPEWNNLDFIQIVNKLQQQSDNTNLIGDFVTEFDPQAFYPVFTLFSRVKTMIKYPNINIAGCVFNQIYNIKNEKTYIQGNETQNTEFNQGSRIIRLKSSNTYIDQHKIRIPNQFVSYQITNNQLNQKELYMNNDRFPDFLEKEDFFTNLIVILEGLKSKHK
jgi:hypothetical protein